MKLRDQNGPRHSPRSVLRRADSCLPSRKHLSHHRRGQGWPH